MSHHVVKRIGSRYLDSKGIKEQLKSVVGPRMNGYSVFNPPPVALKRTIAGSA